MTRLALGAKSSGLTAPRDCAAAAKRRGFRRELSAAIQMPAAPRPRKVRRFTSRAISVSGDGFMEIQNRASHDGHCRKLWKIPDLIFCGIERRLARFDELASIDRRSAEPD